MLFNDAGKQHTARTLEVVREAALARGIKYVAVATTAGDTGVAAARLFEGTGVKALAVTHNAGFKEPGAQELLPELRDEILRLGGAVYTGTIPTRSIGTAIRNRFEGFSTEQVVASTLRMFGQGAKVCAEIAAMVCDAGLVPAGEDIICVAGTGGGADTAVVVAPRSANCFFDIKIREFLAKPADW